MQCQKCGEKEAKVHLTKIINNKKQELHLCSECAEEIGQISFSSDPFSFKHLLSGMIKPDFMQAQIPASQVQTCDNCGLSYQEFAEQGLFGCARCYDNFSQQIEYIIRKVQGGSEHRGKIPLRQGEEIRLQRKIKDLRVKINEAVAVENFEKAAELRDKIKDLENKLGENDEQK